MVQMKVFPARYSEQFFSINEQDLKGELVRLAPDYARVIFEFAQAKIAKTNAEMVAKRVRALNEVELRSTFEGTGKKMPNVDYIESMLTSMPAVIEADVARQEAEDAYVNAEAVVSAFAKKKDLLVSLAGLSRSELETIGATR